MSATVLVRSLWGAAGLLAVGVGYMLVDAALFLATDLGPPPIPVDGPARVASADVSRQPGVDLASLNLFGDPDAGPAEAAEPVSDAPETRLAIKLIGVFVAARSADSTAIIRGDRDEAIYRVGDRLPGNATLVEVHPDYVLLRRAGGPERLSFEEPKARLMSIRQTGGRRRVSRSYEPLEPTPTSAREPNGDSSERGTARVGLARPGHGRSPSRPIRNAREFLDEYAERLADDPAKTLAELGIEAVSRGSSSGYRLGDVASPDQLSKVGLRPGDVVLSVNGQQLGNAQQDTALIEQVTEAGAARLEIQRGDRRFYVTLSIPRN